MPQVISTGQDVDDYQEEIYSEDVHAILTKVPNWLIRWGITLVFLGVGLIIFLSWFIKYPDVVTGSIQLTAASPPIEVMSRSEGTILPLKNNDDYVEKGMAIAIIENPADPESISKLKKNLASFKRRVNRGGSLDHFNLSNTGQLGELQSYFNILEGELINYKNLQVSALNNVNRQHNIAERLLQYESKKEKFIEQLKLQEQELKLAEESYFQRYVPLFNDGIVSQTELDFHKNSILKIKSQIKSTQSYLNDNDNAILSLKNQRQEITFEKGDLDRSKLTSILNSISELENQIYMWEQRYVIHSPADGKVEYLSKIKSNSYVRREEPVFYIIPDKNEKVLGEMFIAESGSGKVELGQKVIIELNSFNKSEFGTLRGTVKDISEMSSMEVSPTGASSGYQLQIDLEDGMASSYKKEIPFRHNMQGRGEIVTKNKRIIERVFEQVLSLFDK